MTIRNDHVSGYSCPACGEDLFLGGYCAECDTWHDRSDYT